MRLPSEAHLGAVYSLGVVAGCSLLGSADEGAVAGVATAETLVSCESFVGFAETVSECMVGVLIQLSPILDLISVFDAL